MAKAATIAQKKWIMLVKSQPCIVCDAPPPSEFHHICDTGRRMGHEFGLPLCINCHRGQDGFTGKNRSAWDKSLPNQLLLCERLYERLERDMPEYTSKVVKSSTRRSNGNLERN